LKILHIISGDLWAGAEAMAYQLLSGLHQLDGIDLHLIILNEGRLEQLCKKLGIKCYLIDEQKLSVVAIIGRSIRVARKIRPNIIHAHRYKENILSALAAVFCGRPKLVTTQHGRTEADKVPVHKKIISKINHAFLRWVFTEAVAVSRDTADYLVKICGLKPEKLSIIPNGISIPLTSRSVNDKKGRFFTIGSAGRLFPVKQFNTFIEIARRVCRVKSLVRFVIAGEGPERDALQSMISQYELDGRVRLLGHVDAMQGFYNELDLYINTSIHEGTPMSILEAMANGLPVIAFDVGGLKDIITDGADGFTIPEGDKAQFIYRTLELVDHPQKLITFGEVAHRKIIDCFSTTRMVEGYQELYQRISETDNL
jgi:glycosyltransferase involved in cell wall biosynthesis